MQAKDKRIDPIGACVGMRGSRVQSVSNELAGERVDIVLWDDNPAQFVINAMAPAEVEIDRRRRRSALDGPSRVAEDKLAQAIGRGGQNVRLASELTGWVLNVMTAGRGRRPRSEPRRTSRRAQMFMEKLDVDEEIAGILVHGRLHHGRGNRLRAGRRAAGRSRTSTRHIVEELRSRARDVLLTKAIAKAEDADDAKPADDLLAVEGMDEDTAYALAAARRRHRARTSPTWRPTSCSRCCRAGRERGQRADHGRARARSYA